MERLSADFDRADAIALTATLLVAGQTTSQTLGNILLHLLQAPAAARVQAADPAWVARHLETLLRLHASPQFIDRVATEDRRIGGCPFRAGDHVHMHLPSINRDPDAFPWEEGGEASVAHLSFGTGIHKCPGAAYGRMVIRTALPRLFARYPQLRLDIDQPQWLETTFVRAPVSLPCTLHP
nr:cytochrome P450 [Pseudomonas sp. RIT-PI-AD]